VRVDADFDRMLAERRNDQAARRSRGAWEFGRLGQRTDATLRDWHQAGSSAARRCG
jgi:hypothetical protein